MNFRSILRKGISLKKQHAGQIEDGPLGPVLRVISEIRVVNLTGDDPAEAAGVDDIRVARVDRDVTALATPHRVPVLTGDSGARRGAGPSTRRECRNVRQATGRDHRAPGRGPLLAAPSRS